MTEEKNADVELVKVELEVGKETKEVADALHDLVEDIRAKKSITDISVENLPGLVRAIEGVDKLDDEAKHRSRNATMGYCGYKVGESLMPVKSE